MKIRGGGPCENPLVDRQSKGIIRLYEKKVRSESVCLLLKRKKKKKKIKIKIKIIERVFIGIGSYRE